MADIRNMDTTSSNGEKVKLRDIRDASQEFIDMLKDEMLTIDCDICWKGWMLVELEMTDMFTGKIATIMFPTTNPCQCCAGAGFHYVPCMT